jgi:hypothetical protein
MAKGVVRPPPKAPPPPKKKEKEKWVLAFWGWPDHPQGSGGGFGHPKPAFWGGRIHPQVLGGGLATPKRPKPIFRFFFFFCLGFWGWPDHPLGHGGGSTTSKPAVGVAPATPYFFSPPLFNIFLFLFFFLFFLKKNDKMAKTTSF